MIFSKAIIYTTEIFMTTLVKCWLLLTRRLRSTTHPDLRFDISKRYIYVANHASYLDPIVLWCALRFRQRIHGAPTKVMTAPFVYFSVLRPLIWLLGAYPAKKKEGQRVHAGVEGSLYYLHHGYNICIFPEGKRSLQEERRAFNGVSDILAKTDSYEMILVQIMWGPGPWWKRTLSLRSQVAPNTLNHHDPQEIMSYIYNM